MFEPFASIQSTKKMGLLKSADHVHFEDQVEDGHQWFRTKLLAAVLAKRGVGVEVF